MITSTAKPLTRTIVAPLLRDQYRLFRESSRTGDEAAAWRALEWEHILSQPYMGAHLASHWHMFRYAIELGDSREAAGQVVRFMLVPLGSLTGRLPAGHNGRPRVDAFSPVPVPGGRAGLVEGGGA